MAAGSERDFQFTTKDFERVRSLARQHTGIALSDAKQEMVYSRLGRRLRQLGIDTFSDYLDLVERQGFEGELTEFTNAITTNLTSFFRENHHFEYLAQTMLPELMRLRASERHIRIWCSASSTGEEPYSIAMVVKEVMPKNSGWDIKILATDLDTNVLATAERGIYQESRINGISAERKKRFFLRGKNKQVGFVRVVPELRQMITFRKLNLMDKQWPMRGPLDIIFCRNVMIYFTKETQKTIVERFSELLADDGYLVMGHSETLYKVSDRFELIGKTMYRPSR